MDSRVISGSTFGPNATIFLGNFTSTEPLPTVNNAAHADGPPRASRRDKTHPIPLRLPHPPNSHFTGREEVIRILTDTFQPTNAKIDGRWRRKEIMLHGLPGVGKTEIALEYAYRQREAYSAIFWMHANGASDFETSAHAAVQIIIKHYERTWRHSTDLYHRIALCFNVVEKWIQSRDTLLDALGKSPYLKRLSDWLDHDSKPGWLLVLDNYDDTKSLDLSILPRDKGHVLVTSRLNNTRPDAELIFISESIEPNDAIRLLSKTYGKEFQQAEEQECASKIVKFVGYFPLAIAHIGVLLRKTQEPIQHFTMHLQAKARGTKQKVYAIWECSLGELSPNALELLQLFSLIDDKGIPLEILQGEGRENWMGDDDTDEDDTDRSPIGELISLSLLGKEETGNRYIHPLLHEWIKNRFQGDPRVSHHPSLIVSMVSSTITSDRQNTASGRDYIRSVMPHIERCSQILLSQLVPKNSLLDYKTQRAAYNLAGAYASLGEVGRARDLYEAALGGVKESEDTDEFGLQIIISAGMNYCLLGNHDLALEQYNRALSVSQLNHGEESPLTLTVRHNIAKLYTDKGQYSEGMEEYKRVLTTKKGIFGETHASTLETRQSLAVLYRKAGLYKEALEEVERIYSARTESPETDQVLILETAHAKGAVLEHLGRYAESLELHYSVLKGQQQHLGERHYSTLDTMDSIASVYERQGEYYKALEWHDKILDTLRSVFTQSDKHPYILHTLSGQADILMRLAEYEKAEAKYRQAYAGYQSLHMGVNGEFPTAMNLGRVLRELGRYEDALKLFQQADQGFENKLNASHVYRRVLCFHRASVLDLKGDYKEALALYQKTLEVGVEPTLALTTKCYMANVHRILGDYLTATKLYQESKDGFLGALGGNHLLTLMANCGIANLQEELGDADSALDQYNEVATQLQKNKLERNQVFLNAQQGKGRILVYRGKLAEGIEILQSARHDRERIVGKDHPAVFMTLLDIGNAYQKNGQKELALEVCKQALEGCCRTLGEFHYQTSQTKVGVAHVLFDQKKFREARELYSGAVRGFENISGRNSNVTLSAIEGLRNTSRKLGYFWEYLWLSITVAAGRKRLLKGVRAARKRTKNIIT